MGGIFDHILSVEMVQKFKTDPEVYQLGPDAFDLPAREILFVSANSWDACAATWFGYTTFWINRTGQPPEQLKSEFDRVFSTGESVQVETVVEQGGERRVYLMSRLPMRLEGDAITHVITIGEDVTEARNVQEQVIRHEKMAAVGQLVAGVMHEINNPLATIAACAAAVDARLGTQAEPAVKEYLEIIDKEVQRSTKIVDGLLEFSRPHPSPGRPKADVDVNKVIERTLFLLKHHRRFKRLQVETDLGPPVAVRANDEQLIQVLMALMLNAVDAMPDGGVLTLRSKRVTGRHEAIIEVKDTGSG
ncbi:MAG: HAD-IA family hydrolase, partial [Gemmatimonadetes bacterium]|nr:HAD-IA family hydrolase [Gemmatimonadota bacterium]